MERLIKIDNNCIIITNNYLNIYITFTNSNFAHRPTRNYGFFARTNDNSVNFKSSQLEMELIITIFNSWK